MPTLRKPTSLMINAIDRFHAPVRRPVRPLQGAHGLRHYLIGLLPREQNKTLVELAALVPGANRPQLHHFLHDAPWDAETLNRRRLQRWQIHPYLGPHAQGVLIVDETGDLKCGHRTALAAQKYLGKLGHVANGAVAATSYWADGNHHVLLAVSPTDQPVACPRASAPSRLHPLHGSQLSS